MMIASCDSTINPGNNTQDPSLDGIDISKFEKIVTEIDKTFALCEKLNRDDVFDYYVIFRKKYRRFS